MKKNIGFGLLVMSLLVGCKKDLELPVLTEDEYPRILGRWPDRLSDGTLGSFGTQAGQPLSISLQFTPSNLCQGTWYLDDKEVATGTVLELTSDTAATHHLKLLVKTPKYTTSREALVIFN